jgi:hypothetical protein
VWVWGGGPLARSQHPLVHLPDKTPKIMPSLLSAIGSAFEEAPPTSTLKDIGLVERRLGAFHFGGTSSAPSSTPAAPGSLSLEPGLVYVHAKRNTSVPVLGALPRSGIPSVDASFHRRGEQLLQDMARDYSDFSLTGLAWAEQRTCCCPCPSRDRTVPSTCRAHMPICDLA